ncbi:capsule assembly Wzi family protein, partial [Acinetobacter pittii]
YLELGASRTLQWGGEGRSESWDSLWNAIKGNDNVYDSDEDRSNQIAGFDARLNLQSLINAPVGIYG